MQWPQKWRSSEENQKIRKSRQIDSGDFFVPWLSVPRLERFLHPVAGPVGNKLVGDGREPVDERREERGEGTGARTKVECKFDDQVKKLQASTTVVLVPKPKHRWMDSSMYSEKGAWGRWK